MDKKFYFILTVAVITLSPAKAFNDADAQSTQVNAPKNKTFDPQEQVYKSTLQKNDPNAPFANALGNISTFKSNISATNANNYIKIGTDSYHVLYIAGKLGKNDLVKMLLNFKSDPSMPIQPSKKVTIKQALKYKKTIYDLLS